MILAYESQNINLKFRCVYDKNYKKQRTALYYLSVFFSKDSQSQLLLPNIQSIFKQK